MVSCAWQMAGEMRMKMRASIRKSRKLGRGCLGSTPGQQQQHRQRRRSPSRLWQSTSRRPKRTVAGPTMRQMMTSRGKTSVRHPPACTRICSMLFSSHCQGAAAKACCVYHAAAPAKPAIRRPAAAGRGAVRGRSGALGARRGGSAAGRTGSLKLGAAKVAVPKTDAAFDEW